MIEEQRKEYSEIKMDLVRAGDTIAEGALDGSIDSAVTISLGSAGISVSWAGAGMDGFRALGVLAAGHLFVMQKLMGGR